MAVKLYEVTIKYSVETVGMENVIHMTYDGTAQALCTYLTYASGGEFFLKEWSKCMITGAVFSTVTAKEIGHLLLDPDYYELAVVKTGEIVGAHSDPQLAALAALHTGYSGRKRRGRVFMGGTDDAAVEGGRLTAGGQAVIQQHLNTAAGYLDGSAGKPQWVVFSRTIFSGLSDIILDSYKPVTSVTVRAVMSTMRSRLPAQA